MRECASGNFPAQRGTTRATGKFPATIPTFPRATGKFPAQRGNSPRQFPHFPAQRGTSPIRGEIPRVSQISSGLRPKNTHVSLRENTHYFCVQRKSCLARLQNMTQTHWGHRASTHATLPTTCRPQSQTNSRNKHTVNTQNTRASNTIYKKLLAAWPCK